MNWKPFGVVGLFFLSLRLYAIALPDLNVAPGDPGVDFAQQETQLQAEARANGIAPQSHYYQLAEKYLVAHRLQEAIWTLRRGEYFEDARQVEDALRNFLLTAAPLGAGQGMGKGVCASQRIQLPGGISGLFKCWRENGHPDMRMEIVASDLDRYLGFNLVPLTVKREIDGIAGSFQYFVQDARETGISIRDGHGMVPQAIRIHTFDQILGNTDRHHQNWMYRPGELAVAIDHSHSTISYALPSRLARGIDDNELAETARLLGNVDLNAASAALGTYLRPEEVQVAVQHIIEQKNWYQASGFSVEPRMLYGGGPQAPAMAAAPVEAPAMEAAPLPAPELQAQMDVHVEAQAAPAVPAPAVVPAEAVALVEIPLNLPPAGVPLDDHFFRLFEDLTRQARRAEVQNDRERALAEMIRILEQPALREQILPKIVDSKRVAHLFEEEGHRFPREIIEHYGRALREYAPHEEAHARALQSCERLLAGEAP